MTRTNTPFVAGEPKIFYQYTYTRSNSNTVYATRPVSERVTHTCASKLCYHIPILSNDKDIVYSVKLFSDDCHKISGIINRQRFGWRLDAARQQAVSSVNSGPEFRCFMTSVSHNEWIWRRGRTTITCRCVRQKVLYFSEIEYCVCEQANMVNRLWHLNYMKSTWQKIFQLIVEINNCRLWNIYVYMYKYNVYMYK